MRKFSFVLVLFLLVSMFLVPAETAATAPVDQMCGSVSDNILAEIGNGNKVFQTFVPTKNTIDAVGAFLTSNENRTIKIKVQIYNISSIWNFALVVDKFASLDSSSGYKLIDLPDTRLDPGYYALSFQTVHEEDNAKWVGTHYECYPNGNAIIGSENMTDANMTFTTYGYDAATESSSTPDQSVTTNDASSSDDSAPDSQPSNSRNSTGSSTSDSSDSVAISSEAPAADTPGVNVKNDQVAPMTDEELAEFIKWIMEDYEANRSHGIFGLNGVLGSILTWPVVIGVGSLILLIIVIGIILLVTRSKSKTPPSVTPPPTRPPTNQ